MRGVRIDQSEVGEQAVRVGVVDIGTNSMRLLITDGTKDWTRRAVVTGLGRGVDETGRLGETEMAASVRALEEFGRAMDNADVEHRSAIATSATRDSANREEFVARATTALGVEPDVIDGVLEGRLAFNGAVSDLDGEDWLVNDIGGGSTEFVDSDESCSVDIGSVRLTDRVLKDRPPRGDQLQLAFDLVAGLFADLEVDTSHRLLGVAGTWTTLAVMINRAQSFAVGDVHHHVIQRSALDELVAELSTLTVRETAERFPGIDPERCPVVLAGAVVATSVMSRLGASTATISERDTLDGIAMRLLALA